jgi:O-antigen ligase
MGPRPIIRFSKPLLVYLGSVIVSMLVARDPILSVFEVALFVQMFFLYVYIASTVMTKQDIRFLAGMLLFGLVAESLLMFMLLHGGSPPLAWALRPRVDLAKNPLDPSRVAGTIGSANSAAAYLGLSLLFAVSVLFSRMSPTLKILAGVGVVLGTFGLISTFSRGGWLTTSICLALLLWLIAGATRKNLVKVLVVLALLGAIPLFFQDEISTRLAADDRGSAYSRIPLMKLASRMIEDHPILGVGSNNFGVTLDEYVTGDFRGGGFLYAVHNQYLLIWTETGVVGLVSFVWFLTSSIGKGLRCWRLGDPVLSPLALGLSLGLVAFMLHMAVDIFRGRPLAQLVWVAAALISSIADVLGKPTPPTLSSAS